VEIDFFTVTILALINYILSLCGFMSTNKLSVISQPSYSPDLVLCDLTIFPELKMVLKGRFNDVTMMNFRILNNAHHKML